jgi:hypothetical protein
MLYHTTSSSSSSPAPSPPRSTSYCQILNAQCSSRNNPKQKNSMQTSNANSKLGH